MNKLDEAIMDLETHCLQKEDCGFIYGTYIPYVESVEYKNAIELIKQALIEKDNRITDLEYEINLNANIGYTLEMQRKLDKIKEALKLSDLCAKREIRQIIKERE